MANCLKIFLLYVSFLLLSCNESNEVVRSVKYPDGNIEVEQVKLKGDSSMTKIIYYFKNGQVRKEYFVLHDSMRHGLFKSYYSNGKLEIVGNWKNDFKVGNHRYYDSLGKLIKIISFIRYHDTAIARPNQIYYYDQDQKLIAESPSLFYKLKNEKDTINFGEELMLSIQLFGAKFPNTYLKICDYNEEYKLVSPMYCDTIHIVTDRESRIGKTGLNRGVNIIRGAIVNYKYLDKQKREKIEVFFSDTVFVR